MMSGGLTKIAQTAQSTSVKIQQAATTIETSLRKAWNNASTSVDKYTKSLKNAITEQTKVSKSGGGGSGGLAGIAGMAGRFIAPVAIGAMLLGAGKSAIGGATRAEQDLVGLSTFLGKEGANAAYANIRKDAVASSFDTAGMLTANRALISTGISAEQARKDIWNLANAVSAVGGGNDELGRMAANLQQIKATGQATAMDIRQFGIAGINIYEMLKQTTGKNIEQIKEMNVSYEMLSAALAQAAGKGGMYFGALEAQAKTTQGRFNALKETISMSLADLGTAFLPVIKTGLDIANSFLEKIVAWFQSISINTGEWSAYITVAQTVLGSVWNVVKSVAGFVWYILGGMVEWIKKSELMRDIFTAIGWVVGKVGDVVMWVVDKLKWLWDNVLKPILDDVELLYKATKNLFTNGAVKFTQETKTSSVGALAATAASDSGLGGVQKNMMAGKAGGGGEVAKEVTSGGPRVINISGVKFTDKIEIHSTTLEGGMDDIENKLMNMFARLLNSGAAIQ